MTYFKDIQSGIRTTLKGLSLTFRHLRNATHRRSPAGIADTNYFDQQNGLVTLQYPHEQLPIPDNGRYRLRNEIEDCIVCDKCAKICPVDCITIDAIKATEEIGRASDGSPIRLYAAKFDIDMAKCCYCGLCTVVCPTECLTMDKTFDYSEFELGKLTYSFAELTPEQADEKRTLYEQFVREKELAKAAQATAKSAATATPDPASTTAPVAKRPVFRPTARPTTESSGAPAAEPTQRNDSATNPVPPVRKPVFNPTQKPKTSEDEKSAEPDAPVDKPQARPAFRPSMKPPVSRPGVANSEEKEARKPVTEQNSAGSALAHPLTDATPGEMERIAEAGRESVGLPDGPLVPEPTPRPKPAFRPSMKPTKPVDPESTPVAGSTSDEPAKPRPAFRPTMKPVEPVVSPEVASVEKAPDLPLNEPRLEETPKSRPVFRPTMKPKSDDAESA